MAVQKEAAAINEAGCSRRRSGVFATTFCAWIFFTSTFPVVVEMHVSPCSVVASTSPSMVHTERGWAFTPLKRHPPSREEGKSVHVPLSAGKSLSGFYASPVRPAAKLPSEGGWFRISSTFFLPLCTTMACLRNTQLTRLRRHLNVATFHGADFHAGRRLSGELSGVHAYICSGEAGTGGIYGAFTTG